MGALLDLLLEKRGIPADERSRFLAPDYERDIHPPGLLDGMERAVERILAAIDAREKIAVYADFDCDGIPGAALFADLFEKIAYEHAETYIPHRDTEGHGLHVAAIEKLAAKGVTLVITVDVGVSAVDAARRARELGVDLIITDHHEPPAVLPECVAVINPKLGEYPFRDLCGAAVAWKLVVALVDEGKRRRVPRFDTIANGWEKWLLDLVAIATIADLVPLTGENRALAHFGLLVLRKSPRLGLRTLLASLRIAQHQVTEEDVSFAIAPRINAASRMDEPMLAFRLLRTHGRAEADALVAQLEDLNAKRKGAVAHMVKEARRRVAARYRPEDRVVVIGDTAWRPSLAGLVANSIMGERGGAVCVWGETGTGDIKGSCRSDGSIPIVELLSKADVFIEFGGHDASGGFSISREKVHTLPEALTRAGEGLVRSRSPIAAHDATLSLRQVSWALYEELSQLAPFGVGNDKPVFRIAQASVRTVRRFGKEKNHTEVEFECFESGARARSFDFFRAPDGFTRVPEGGATVDILATLSRDAYRGERALALRLIDIVPSDQ